MNIDWTEFYGLTCTALAKLPSEVRRITVKRAVALMAYWRKSPPTHVLVAGFLRVKEERPVSDDELGAIFGL